MDKKEFTELMRWYEYNNEQTKQGITHNTYGDEDAFWFVPKDFVPKDK